MREPDACAAKLCEVCLLKPLYGDPGPELTRWCLRTLAERGADERARRAVTLAMTVPGMIRWATW